MSVSESSTTLFKPVKREPLQPSKLNHINEITNGLCKEKKSKNPRLLWQWVGGSRSQSDIFQSSQNSPKQVLIFLSCIPCAFCLYTLLKVVGYYDLSVLSMSVMGFPNKLNGGGWVGGGGGGELYPLFVWDFLNFF